MTNSKLRNILLLTIVSLSFFLAAFFFWHSKSSQLLISSRQNLLQSITRSNKNYEAQELIGHYCVAQTPSSKLSFYFNGSEIGQFSVGNDRTALTYRINKQSLVLQIQEGQKFQKKDVKDTGTLIITGSIVAKTGKSISAFFMNNLLFTNQCSGKIN